MALIKFLKGFRDGFRVFSGSVAYAVNILVLIVVYFVGIGVTAVFSRIFRKRFLPIGKKGNYWVKRNLGKQKLDYYKRTF